MVVMQLLPGFCHGNWLVKPHYSGEATLLGTVAETMVPAVAKALG